jgi:signal peptidase I
VSSSHQRPESADRPADSGGPEGLSEKRSEARRRAYRPIINILAVGALVAGLLYVHTRVVRVAYIPTGSMIPTLRPGDRVLISLGAFRHRSPQRGDIVAFWDPDSGDYQVKRVIAVHGDSISIYWGVVFLNGEVLREPYVARPMLPEHPLIREVGEGELFVMGDNRNASEDSRDNGPISQDAVLGRVFFRILPLRSGGKIR